MWRRSTPHTAPTEGHFARQLGKHGAYQLCRVSPHILSNSDSIPAWETYVMTNRHGNMLLKVRQVATCCTW